MVAHLLNPNPAELTWKLVGEWQAYEHFSYTSPAPRHRSWFLGFRGVVRRVESIDRDRYRDFKGHSQLLKVDKRGTLFPDKINVVCYDTLKRAGG